MNGMDYEMSWGIFDLNWNWVEIGRNWPEFLVDFAWNWKLNWRIWGNWLKLGQILSWFELELEIELMNLVNWLELGQIFCWKLDLVNLVGFGSELVQIGGNLTVVVEIRNWVSWNLVETIEIGRIWKLNWWKMV